MIVITMVYLLTGNVIVNLDISAECVNVMKVIQRHVLGTCNVRGDALITFENKRAINQMTKSH